MNIEKNNIESGTFDQKTLLNELANDIASKFGIDKVKAEKLIKSETLVSLDSLKNELKQENSNKKTLDTKELEKLFFTLKGALDLIENSSKLEIKTLKNIIEDPNNIENSNNIIESKLPKKLVEKAKNPEKLHEHILGFTLGTANSIITTVDVLYRIGKGIIKTPYHLYLIINGKAETNSFKNI